MTLRLGRYELTINLRRRGRLCQCPSHLTDVGIHVLTCERHSQCRICRHFAVAQLQRR